MGHEFWEQPAAKCVEQPHLPSGRWAATTSPLENPNSSFSVSNDTDANAEFLNRILQDTTINTPPSRQPWTAGHVLDYVLAMRQRPRQGSHDSPKTQRPASAPWGNLRLKRKDIPTPALMQMNPEDIMVSGRGQTQRDEHCGIPPA